MSDDLQQFKATYIEECKELLKDMEDHLVTLSNGEADKEVLNAIFRCAHSIKGGAGAFGFTRITGFTHILETLLDDLRNDKIPASQDVCDVLLESKDVMEELISLAEKNAPMGQELGARVEQDLNRILNGGIAVSEVAKPKAAAVEAEDKNKFLLINFKPHKNCLQTGNEPLLIFRELAGLGKMTVNGCTDAVPEFADLDPTSCYLTFEAQLETSKPMSEVNAVFEFVEDVCDLHIDAQAGIFTPHEHEPPQNDNGAPVESKAAANSAKNDPKKDDGGNNSIRVDVEKIDKLVNLVGELVITQAMIHAQTKNLAYDQFGALINGIEELAQHTRVLQDEVVSVRMEHVEA